MNTGQHLPLGSESQNSIAALAGQNSHLGEAAAVSDPVFSAKRENSRTGGPMEYLNLYHYLTANCSTDSILDVMDARLLIEPVIAQSAAIQRDEDDLTRIKANLEKMAACTAKGRLITLDIEFHCLIAAATKNGVLPLVVHQIYRLINKVESKFTSEAADAKETTLASYRQIFDAISKRDGLSAAELMREHLLVAQSKTEEMMIIELIK